MLSKISLILLYLVTCANTIGFSNAVLYKEACDAHGEKPKPEYSLNFEPCEVDDKSSASKWEAVDLQPFITQWNSVLDRDCVPSITVSCTGGTAAGCERGRIGNWTAANNNGRARQIVIDTDLQNEVDDYFAVAWALLSSAGPSAQVNVTSIIAGPFSFRYRFLPLVTAQELFMKDELNGYDTLKKTERDYLYGPPSSPGGKSSSLLRLKDVGVTPKLMIERDNHATWCPDRGMEESYQGLLKFVQLFGKAKEAGVAPVFADVAKTPVFRGQTKYVTGIDPTKVEPSEGILDLITKATKATVNDPLFVVCIGAPTNVASALLFAPEIVSKIVVLWDASWSLQNRGRVVSGSLNTGEDQVASRVLLESGVRMLYFPGFPSGQALQLSAPEVEAWYKGQGAVSDALFQRYNNNPDTQFSGLGYGRYRNAGTTRIMWDVGNLIPFILPGLLSAQAVSAPRLQRVETVPNTCHGFETIGTTCMAYYPSSKEKYPCKEIDQYDLTRCNDAFYVDFPPEERKRDLVEAVMLGGLSGPGGSGIDLLHKLQAAGL
mmetsp:Transcript_27665/g.40072  ORF Transcript_27665/g.40072 Transcript_27665/m.40072 type:complete len:547 (+) Transcript_27665:91-1731(+)